VSEMRIFKALRIKKDSKRGSKTPNTVKPWPEPRSKMVKKEVEEGAPENHQDRGPTACPWWSPQTNRGQPCFLELASFLRGYSCSMRVVVLQT